MACWDQELPSIFNNAAGQNEHCKSVTEKQQKPFYVRFTALYILQCHQFDRL